MVKFYDKNMNEVYLPKDTDLHYGSYPLELNISSIEYEKQGKKRVPIGRQASLSAFIIASRETDMKLKIKRIYEFFRTLGEFYVADSDTPFELLKVSVDQSYDIGFGNGALIDYEIPLNVHKPYFKQSLHTTLDIDSEGVRWNDKWGYGMGLSSDKSEWKYSFDTDAGQSYNFKFLNAGTEEVKLIQQKDSRIRVEFKVSGSWFEISDGSTTFRLNKSYVNGDVLVIRGSKVFFNGQNVLQDTNHNFLTVKKGMNTWQTRGPKYYDFEIDFRFLYD